MTGGPVYLIFILCCNSSLKDPGGSWMSYKTHLHANYSLREIFIFTEGHCLQGNNQLDPNSGFRHLMKVSEYSSVFHGFARNGDVTLKMEWSCSI